MTRASSTNVALHRKKLSAVRFWESCGLQSTRIFCVLFMIFGVNVDVPERCFPSQHGGFPSPQGGPSRNTTTN